MCGSWVTRRTVLSLAVQLLEEGEHLLARLRVEGAGRLVGEEERRRVRQGARDGDALALAARERGRQHVRLLGDPDRSSSSSARRRRSLRRRPRRAAAARRCARSRPSGAGCSSGRRSRPSRCGFGASAAPESPSTCVPSSAYVPAVGESRQPRIAISVDLPEPEGPTRATNSPRRDRQVDAAERVDGHAVRPEDLRQAARLDDRAHAQLSSSFSTFFFVGSSSATCSPPLRPDRISTRSSVAMPAVDRHDLEVVLPVVGEPDELAAAVEPLLRVGDLLGLQVAPSGGRRRSCRRGAGAPRAGSRPPCPASRPGSRRSRSCRCGRRRRARRARPRPGRP